ncbi:uncharacterized protein LOC110819230 [Carica papaya]|uniref:uncharacterized protein LOC110819230 n=1 Tax=Carica papaya TaxID=3649 RepID=UPI000B8CA8B9|nr:uncharacterized protein LOC110819230 [Carica papaya]
MESSAVLRFAHCSALHAQHMVEKPSKVHICNGSWPVSGTSYIQGLTVGKKLTSSPIKRNTTVKLCAKTSDTAVTAKSDVSLESTKPVPKEKKPLQRATFPNGFEALVLDVCDETEIAELKLKVDFYCLSKPLICCCKSHPYFSSISFQENGLNC